MNNLMELREDEAEMVSGGKTVGSITVQSNFNVNPQVAVGVAVLSPNSYVRASNNSFTIQLNLAATI